MEVKISGGVSGVIATASYQNLRPSFSCEITMTKDMSKEEITEKQKELYGIAYGLLKEAETKAIVDRVQREMENIRFYPNPNTSLPTPSVTSVINWDADFFVTPDELKQYASSGQITHARCANFISTGKWVDGRTLKEEVWVDLVIVTQGNLKLPINVGNLPLFLEKFPIDKLENGKVVHLENTAGLPDAHGVPNGWKDAESIPTTFDFKRTPNKIKDGMQLSQYCKAKGHKQGIIIPINDKTTQGFSKAIIYSEDLLKGYDKLFQQQRENFSRRYGI